MNILDLTKEHIKLLNDDDLRTLIGLLVEKEVKSKNISSSSIRYGGNQNSTDSGIDVMVEIPDEQSISGYIKKPITGFQVKTTDFQPSKIKYEMCPKNILREYIVKLAEQNGAYIIVSGHADLSLKSYNNRINEMNNAIDSISIKHNLCLDYYDSNHIAIWVRNYTDIAVWVCN